MNLQFRRSVLEEAATLVTIYNQAFYADYIRYGACPGYGHTVEDMERSIAKNIKYTIYTDEVPVGVISVSDQKNGCYDVGCLCVIPEFQGKGIGQQAIAYIKENLPDWKQITLDTPADKEENVRFYTKKCGFRIVGEHKPGKVKLYQFQMNR